jgi:hypothetical protein
VKNLSVNKYSAGSAVKNFLKNYAVCLAIANLVLIIICIAVKARLNIQYAFPRVEIAALITALFASLSVLLFRMKRGNIIVKIILGFLALVPSVFVMRRLFGVVIFRFSAAIYLLAALIAVVYGVTVFIIAKRSKKEADELNKLIDKKIA